MRETRWLAARADIYTGDQTPGGGTWPGTQESHRPQHYYTIRDRIPPSARNLPFPCRETITVHQSQTAMGINSITGARAASWAQGWHGESSWPGTQPLAMSVSGERRGRDREGEMGLLSCYALCYYGHKLNINNIVKMTNSIAVSRYLWLVSIWQEICMVLLYGLRVGWVWGDDARQGSYQVHTQPPV